MSKPFIIAIDGPGGAGKGTLAERLSAHYGLPHLDTGLTYRFVAQAMLARHIDAADEAQAAQLAQKLDFALMDKQALRQDEIGVAASKISALPQLRQVLTAKQRQFAQNGRGAVLDGRDIGTVVCPEAQVKLYITADAETRARRRFQELAQTGHMVDYETILAELEARDARDSSRQTAPLKPAADAHIIDTSRLSIEEAFQAAAKWVDAAKKA